MTRRIRTIRIEGALAFVPLTMGYEAVIDAADAPNVRLRNWRAMVATNTVYAVSSVQIDGKQKAIFLHRNIMSAPDGTQVDHINGAGLDNRRGNLRFATPAQNQHNRRLGKSNTSGVKGVCFNKKRKKWQACVRLNRKYHYLGLFPTIEDAAAVVTQARADLHGVFARSA